jgi:hypothetical protein
MYEKLDINFDKFIINKCAQDDPFTINYISTRLLLNKSLFSDVAYSDKGRIAEMEYKTLLEMGQDKYRAGIVNIANHIIRSMNLEIIDSKRKRSWKSFL